MEMQYFHKPEDKKRLFEEWKESRMKWNADELGLIHYVSLLQGFLCEEDNS
jgi:hypothetical protein